MLNQSLLQPRAADSKTIKHNRGADVYPSNFAKYILEREGKSIVEDDNGFATYAFVGDTCYIEDIYVIPDKRKQAIASGYADTISQIAKENKCKSLTGSVHISTRGCTASMKALLAYGFELAFIKENMIYLTKNLEQ